jgi:hypothetical protein
MQRQQPKQVSTIFKFQVNLNCWFGRHVIKNQRFLVHVRTRVEFEYPVLQHELGTYIGFYTLAHFLAHLFECQKLLRAVQGSRTMKTFNEKLASWIHATPATEAGINNIQMLIKCRNNVI